MVLNIILSLLIIVLITITVLIVIWWVKYGKQLFNLLLKMQNNMGQLKGQKKPLDVSSLFNELDKVSKMFKK